MKSPFSNIGSITGVGLALLAFLCFDLLTGAASLAQSKTTPAVGKGAQPLRESYTPPAKTDAMINAEALSATQQLLRNQQERESAIAKDPKAKAVDEKARQLLGPNTGKAYELSAQIMESIVTESGGDPVKMQNLILQLQQNPASLEKYLSAEQRHLIRQMASDVEKSQGMPRASGSGQ